MIEHSSCDFKFKFNSATCSSTQKWNKNIYQCGCKKIIVSAKKIIIGILAHVFVRISVKSKYLKIIADTIVTQCDEIIIFMDSLSTKKVNTIAANVTSTASMNWHSKKSKRLLYFAYSFISDHIAIDDYYYLMLLFKTKRYNIKWKIMKFKKFVFKIVRVIISMAQLN